MKDSPNPAPHPVKKETRKAGRLARKMWANPIDLERPNNFLKVYSHKDPSEDRQAIEPVLVLDLSERERLVSEMARTMAAWQRNRYGRTIVDRKDVREMEAEAVLRRLEGKR